MKKMPINSNMNKSSTSGSGSSTRRRSDELTINEKKKTDLLLEASTTNINNLMKLYSEFLKFPIKLFTH